MTLKKYNICIVGSGAGAGPVAFELSKAGYSVVILEKGPFIKTSEFTKDEIVASRREVYSSRVSEEPQVISWKNKKGGYIEKSNRNGGISFWNGNCVGGSSNFMSGYFHRMKPKDFKLLTEYGKIDGANVVDWPIDYQEMEFYYDKVEKLIGVSGEVVNHKFLEPRSEKDFPFPPLKTNIISSHIDNAASMLGIETIPVPRSIISKPFYTRNACYYSNFCGSYGCSSDAKGSSRAALLNQAIKTGNCKIVPNAKVFHLQTNGEGKIISLHYHDKNNQTQKIEAELYIVAAQAIETSRLLLMSKNPDFPNGLANNNGQVGKNLIFSAGGIGTGVFYKEDFNENEFLKIMQPGVFVNRAIQYWYEIDNLNNSKNPVKGGTIDFLWEHANPIRRAIKQKRDKNGNLLIGSDLKQSVYQYFTQRRKLTFEVFNDWLPIDDCRVELDKKEKDQWGDPVAKIFIENHQHDIDIGKYLAAKAKKVLKQMGAREIKSTVNGNPPPNLQAGGCRFGNNPKESVLDVNCKAHEVDNLYVTDGSFIPTGGSVPFTWTIYANSFRVADKIKERLNSRK